MTKDELNQIKAGLNLISQNIEQMISNINVLAKNMNEIDAVEQPEEFKEAAVLYSQAKNQLTQYLLTAVDSLGLTVLDLIEDMESSPKAKLWVPN